MHGLPNLKVILLFARGVDEIWLVANECFLRVHAAITCLVSLLYEWFRTVHFVLHGDSLCMVLGIFP